MTCKTSPFFRLPRELRDRIYAESGGQDVTFKLKIEHESSDNVQCYDAQALGLPTPDLLLVSRQFGDEYAEETYRDTTLRLSASEDEGGSAHPLSDINDKVMKCIKRVAHLEITKSVGGRTPGMPPGVASVEGRVMLHSMLRCMKNVRSVELHRHLDIVPFYVASTASPEEVQVALGSLFAEVSIDGAREDGIKISLLSRAFFHGLLVSTLPSYQWTQIDKQKYPHLSEIFEWTDIRGALRVEPHNRIMYEAKQTDAEASWYGLELKTVQGLDSFDIDRSLTRFENNQRIMAERTSLEGEEDGHDGDQ